MAADFRSYEPRPDMNGSDSNPGAWEPDLGTFTPLATNLSQLVGFADSADVTLQNVKGIDFNPLPDEIDAVVKLFSRGWGVPYWAACVLLQQMLKAHVSKGIPRSGDRRG